MSRSRDYLPFPRGSTATAGDVLIVNQLGSMSAIDGLANQTNPAANQGVPKAGVGGPGQLPTAALPYAPYRSDLVGFVGDAVDFYTFGLGTPMMLRAMQYIPASGTAYLALDGHALKVSTTPGWQQCVVTGTGVATQGNQAVLPDPAYFMGLSTPAYVKPYDWFWVVEEGPAVGIISTTCAPSVGLMSATTGLLLAATTGLYSLGTSDGNFGNSITTTAYGFGQYLVPSTNPTTPTFGTVSTTTGVGTAGTAILYPAYAPTPSGVTLESFTAAGNVGQFMGSGFQGNTSNYIALYVQPFLNAWW
jgi:hypothetical protein